MRYAKPKSLDEAVALLGEGSWRLLAGGTDFYPAQGANPLKDDVLDLNGLDELRHIRQTDEHFVFGARTTWSDIAHAGLPSAFDMLKRAAREIGSVQIQNVATVAGNLCNASPAADGVPPLLALDAEVELRSASGTRILPLGDFILGNRRTARRQDELLTAVRMPRHAAAGTSHFVKLGARRYLVISIAMAAARIVPAADGRVAEAAVAVGACSAVAVRLSGLEAAMTGRTCGELAELTRDYAFPEISPIDDVRGSAFYRRAAVREIVCRAILGVATPARSEAA